MDYSVNRSRMYRGNYNRMSSGCSCNAGMSPRNNAECSRSTPGCGGSGCAAECPLGMAYIPDQIFTQLYAPEKAFRVGTIFSQLDLPFMMSNCKGGCS